MNAYELADDAKNIHTTIEALEFVQKAVPMLRQQADLIRNLQKSLGFKNSGYETINLTPQTKPLSDEEIKELIPNSDSYDTYLSKEDFVDFARAIEERHGIK